MQQEFLLLQMYFELFFFLWIFWHLLLPIVILSPIYNYNYIKINLFIYLIHLVITLPRLVKERISTVVYIFPWASIIWRRWIQHTLATSRTGNTWLNFPFANLATTINPKMQTSVLVYVGLFTDSTQTNLKLHWTPAVSTFEKKPHIWIW